MAPRLIIYAGDDLRAIEVAAGAAEYSYRFVVSAFLPVLGRIGAVHRVGHLDEVEPLRLEAEAKGEVCLVLSFVPPHKTTLFLRVPLIPVFAWEYENIPTETWDGQPKHDWRYVLAQTGRAITLSTHSADVVRRTMGARFPAAGIPPPVFDRLEPVRARLAGRLPNPRACEFDAYVVDTARLGLHPGLRIPPLPDTGASVPDRPEGSPEAQPPAATPAAAPGPARPAPARGAPVRRMAALYRARLRPHLPNLAVRVLSRAAASARYRLRAARRRPPPPAAAPTSRRPPPRVRLELAGVVYLAVLNPSDGRKNWTDLVSAFTWGLRDRADATLVVKLTASTTGEYWPAVFRELRRQPAFACRVVFVHGYLDDERMSHLLESASYVVNVSRGEGCALPLLEGMSVGRPALAPMHTAMLDYITPEAGFPITSHPEITGFPQDSRARVRTAWHIPHWESIRDAFVRSHDLARHDPDGWLAMSDAAIEAQRRFCGDRPVETALRDFLGLPATVPSLELGLSTLDAIPVLAEPEAAA